MWVKEEVAGRLKGEGCKKVSSSKWVEGGRLEVVRKWQFEATG